MTAVFLVYLLLSAALLCPIVLNLTTYLENDGDILGAGVWSAAWVADTLFTEPSSLLDAPFYYPHERTLLRGVHNYLLGIVYAPFYYVFTTPIAAWNALYIATFAFNGFAMFLFVRSLTGSGLAGFLSGLIFAFAPFRFGLYGSTAFESSYWMPLSLLFLLRYFERVARGKGGTWFLLLGFLFYLFQFLIDAVCGIFFAFVFFPYVFFMLFRIRRRARPATYLRVACALAAFVLLIGLVNLPYLLVKKGESEGHRHSISVIQELSADISSYLASPPSNLLYGEITRNFWVCGMDFNFFGAVAYGLAACGLFRMVPAGARRRHNGRKQFSGGWRPGVRREPLAWFLLALYVLILLLSLGPVMHVFRRPVGPGPYMLLYRMLPFWRSLRAVCYMGMPALFCLSVISGYGAAAVLGGVRRERRLFFFALLALVIVAESVHSPPTTFGQEFAVIPGELSPVYRWLIDEGGEGAIIELPMPWEPEELAGGSYGLDSLYVYMSLFHGRRLVNGYSAFYPPEYQTIVNQMKLFPSRETIDILRLLGVRYVVVHTDKVPRFRWQRELAARHPEAGHSWVEAIARTGEFGEDLRLRAHAGHDYIYEVRGEIPPARLRTAPPGKALSRDSWRAAATSNELLAGNAIDGEPGTAWVSSGSQRAGLAFEVDLGSVHALSGMELEPRTTNEYPKNPRIEVSKDGATWEEVEYGEPYLGLIDRLVKDPSETALRFELPSVDARYLRITSTRFDNLFPWSIAELNLYGR